MKTFRIFIILLVTATQLQAQSLYTSVWGEPQNPAVIFLHGGPGYNAASFEATTAAALAESGFFVIAYDRRGEGRSQNMKAAFTFEETNADLMQLYEKFNLEKAALLGHSFGGIVATRFAHAHPENVSAVVLVSAPVNLQQSFAYIIASCRAIYTARNDTAQLNYLDMLSNMDTSSLPYASLCLMQAMQNGFYVPQSPDSAALVIYDKFKTDSLLIRYSSQMGFAAPAGFWQQEQYTTIDLLPELRALHDAGTALYGIYGKEDGLYGADQLGQLNDLIGDTHFLYLDNCSHNVFIDQQQAFISALVRWLKKS
ncbi:MAG: alpha/beta hydrolase [Sphingobacteriales bacterium BACL12 MAG-120813-bin55]|jgi:proline iminopeptidase|nr:MAG: alpha/beta hydrolase [Sphingobacteriales bacterium BACL12 MAG-120813-bin55]